MRMFSPTIAEHPLAALAPQSPIDPMQASPDPGVQQAFQQMSSATAGQQGNPQMTLGAANPNIGYAQMLAAGLMK